MKYAKPEIAVMLRAISSIQGSSSKGSVIPFDNPPTDTKYVTPSAYESDE